PRSNAALGSVPVSTSVFSGAFACPRVRHAYAASSAPSTNARISASPEPATALVANRDTPRAARAIAAPALRNAPGEPSPIPTSSTLATSPRPGTDTTSPALPVFDSRSSAASRSTPNSAATSGAPGPTTGPSGHTGSAITDTPDSGTPSGTGSTTVGRTGIIRVAGGTEYDSSGSAGMARPRPTPLYARSAGAGSHQASGLFSRQQPSAPR